MRDPHRISCASSLRCRAFVAGSILSAFCGAWQDRPTFTTELKLVMCGIVSIFDRSAPIDASTLQRAVDTLDHRGPEKTGLWLSPDARVGLAHARLGLVDLVTGDQPIVSARGNVIVANGEIYGHHEWRRALRREGWQFKTDSDSEVALALYERYGIDFVERLRGEFALAIWDREANQLLCVRDRFGIKPLYYHESGERVLLASEVKALLAAGVAGRLSREQYVQHLLLIKPHDATLFEGIRQVPPGCMLICSDGKTVVRRYWDLDYPRHPQWRDDARSRACAAEALAEHIADAVETRLHADVPMGHYLSGGLDSSAVLGVAAKRLGHRLTAFNVQFDHADYDESAVARDTAESFGAAFRTVAVDSADFADHLEQVVWHAESIGINSNAVARYLQSRAVRDAGFKAVLSGDGADELFYGYNFHQIDYLLSGYAGDETARLATFADVQAAGKLSAAIPPWFRPARNGFASRLIGFTPAWLSIVLNSRTPLRDTLLHADLKRDVTPDLLVSSLIDRLPIHDQLRDRHPVQQSMYLWCKSILCNQILFADRLDMAHSVEVRMPLLDHRLFEFARTLPVSWFFRDGEEKSLFRDAMKPYLTERVHRRVKQPFLAPPSTLQRNGKLFALIQDIVHSPRLAQLGLFDPAQLARLSKLLSDGNEADLSKLEIPLMLIATSYFLCKRFDLSIVD
ncbi:hypothetical protein WS72_09100 [Burkholderia savannae]|uniref:asparagine synthase (glutamine-hydrolyzing) n=2 Tax=Burkholderiaceae TaxID=119060 RepID=A0ABR5THH9_9BURK|nr:hypothetical protein WS72_09100 [Burkholderia savannae]